VAKSIMNSPLLLILPHILSLVGIDDHEGSWNGKTVGPMVVTNFADYLAGTTNEIHSSSVPLATN
jgi:hypothetical protein